MAAMSIGLQWAKHNRTLLLLLLIVALASFLRIYHLGTESLWHDETASVYSSTKSIYIMLGGSLEWQRQPPLYFLALKIWIYLFGDSETALRSLSAILGIASIPLTFLISQKLFSNRVGLIASFLSAISYFLISYSQEARGYAMLVFFTLLSFFILVLLIKYYTPGKWPFIAYFISNTLLIYTHYFGLFVVFAQIFYFILCNRYLRINKRYFWYVQIATAIVFLPWAVAFIIFSIPNSFSMGRPGIVALVDTLRDYSGYGVAGTWLMPIFICLCLLGIVTWEKTCHRKQTDPAQIISIVKRRISFGYDALLLAVWLIFPIAVPFLISQIPLEITGIYRSRYTISAIMTFFILASKGLNVFITKTSLYFIFIIIILVTTFLSGVGLHAYYTTVHKEQWRDAVNLIQSRFRDEDVIVLNEAYFHMAFDYYSKGKLETQAVNNGEEAQKMHSLKVNGKQRLWFVQGPWGSTNTKQYLEEAFNNDFLLFKEEFIGIEVYLYDLRSLFSFGDDSYELAPSICLTTN